MTRLLLDTHVLLWSLAEPSKLSTRAREALEDADNDVFVSAVTAWEISVKRAKGRLTAPDNLSEIIEKRGFTHLPLNFHHAEQAGNLPLHHRDPFDRFLIAQAQIEGLVLVTRDARIPLYGIRTMAA